MKDIFHSEQFKLSKKKKPKQTIEDVCLILRYSLGVSQEEMKQELYHYLPSLEQWAKEYLICQNPKSIGLKA